MNRQFMTKEKLIRENNGYEAVEHEIIKHKEAEEKLRHRLNVEHALARISSRLVGKGETDMNEILKIIGECLPVNGVEVVIYRDDLRNVDKSFQWRNTQTASKGTLSENSDTELFTWGLNQLLHYNNIVISDISLLPPEATAEKTYMERKDIHAALFIPITGMDKNLLGYIAFYDTKKIVSGRKRTFNA